jgi:putative salt-induced outer membrane protein
MRSFSFPMLCLALGLAMAHGGVAAEDTIPEGSWSTSAELGAIATSGNTVGISVTGKIDARQELENWSNEYIVTGYFKEDEITGDDGGAQKERSAERYSLSAKAAYKLLDEGDKLFVFGSRVDDRFGAYTSYSTVAIGHSSRLYNAHGNTIDLELGPGYFSGMRANGESESGFTVRGAAALKWQLSPSAAFSQTLSVERGTSNVHSSAETALSTKINGTMQMKAAFVARNDTNVPEEKKNTDTQTSLTIVYSF